MLHGILEAWKEGDKTAVVISGCLETTESGTDNQLDKSTTANIRRIRCPVSNSSLIIGSYCGRSLFFSHLQCSCVECPCEKLAIDFLFHSTASIEVYLSTNEAVIKEVLDPPLLLIFIVGEKLGVATIFGYDDFIFTLHGLGLF